MRTARRRTESETYHVVSRGTGRQLIYEDDSDRLLFLDMLRESAHKHSVDIFAWCLMGNHFHLLLQAPLPVISEHMKELCGLYAQRFNVRHSRVGHLFQERFKSEPVVDEAHLAAAVRYIHFNPEKAGLASFESYPWSSYGEYTNTPGAIRCCSTETVLGFFDGAEEFVRFHRDMAADESFLDVDTPRNISRNMSDESALEVARTALNGVAPSDVKAYNREKRDAALQMLLKAGLSIRQIERLTGISRGVIQRISKADR